MGKHPSIDDVRGAADRIRNLVVCTPVVRSEWLSEAARVPVWLKLETSQETGSFKVRGAANALLQLDDDELAAGVVAVSSGNHGRAVAHVAKSLGVTATVCLSERVPPAKVEAIQRLGATVVIAGPDQDDADAAARRLVDEDGMTFIHPFDDPRVIAGQGTVGLELMEQVSGVSMVLVPLSGGGLAGGIALTVKALAPSVEVVGVSQDRGPAMVLTINAGHLVDVTEEDTLADALAGGLGAENRHSVHLCSTLLDASTLVTEDEIAAAMSLLYREEGVTSEGGGAVGVAALMSGKVRPQSAVCVVVSGGNIGASAFAEVVGRRE